MNERKNLLIVIGSAPCVLTDIAAVPRVCDYDFLAVGLDAVDRCDCPLKYVATYHPEDLPEIRRRRERAGGNIDYRVISHRVGEGIDIVVPHDSPSGSSALLGTLAAIRLGYRRIVLCGCPLIGKNAAGGDYKNFRKGWEAKAGKLDDRVRSMSGWTAEFLGKPTDEWILGGDVKVSPRGWNR